MPRTIVIYNPSRFKDEHFLPVFWSHAKTYYERHGEKRDQWHWAPCFADVHADDHEAVKQLLEEIKPDIFAVSLYVWNYLSGHVLAEWVKQRWPNCLVITGGPHQYLKYDSQWFAKHPYIDASLPGECYGELCMKEFLDTLTEDGKFNPDDITDLCYPLGKTRMMSHSKKRSTHQSKREFDYTWPAVALQEQHLKEYIDYCQKVNPKSKMLAILETTRGCPYGCTYCDWGGGINAKVLKKDIDVIDQDLKTICGFDLRFLYLADANLGIFDDRDVEITRRFIRYKNQFNSRIKLGYGGFAKTPNKLDYIKQIITLYVENDLSITKEIKLSMQSLDPVVLKNIDRKNIDLDDQVNALKDLSVKNKWPIFVEMMLGLPGMTLDKFYHEINELGGRNLSVLWYEWILLPEAPAYGPEYVKKYGIKMARKNNGWTIPQTNGQHDIVVGSSTYTDREYLEMILAVSWYHALFRGGVFAESLYWLNQKKPIVWGEFIRGLIQHTGLPQEILDRWDDIVNDNTTPCVIYFDDNPVYIGYYFVAKIFFDDGTFLRDIGDYLNKNYDVPQALIDNDIKLTVTMQNYGQKRRGLLATTDYRQGDAEFHSWHPWITIRNDFYLYKNSGYILRATQKWLGIF